MKRQEKGITLVALVVTIIVLLILAGVAINLTVGNNGLFKRAEDAKLVSEQSSVLEELRMITYEKTLELEKSSIKYIDYLKAREIIKEEEETKYAIDVEKLTGNISTGIGSLMQGDIYYIVNGDLYYLDKNKEEKNVGKVFEEAKTITFEVEGIKLTALEGETWEEWINNKENWNQFSGITIDENSENYETIGFFAGLFEEIYDDRGWGYRSSFDTVSLIISIDFIELRKSVNGKEEKCLWNEAISEEFSYYWVV